MHRPDTTIAKSSSQSRKVRGAMSQNSLFSRLQVGPYRLNHRVVMAPLTRMRAERLSLAPRTLNAEYYGQRATPGGLIIAEASPVAATGRGNPATPGIYSDQQVEGWRKVVDAVHAKGGFIFLQLWHVGRVSHSSLQPGGVLPVALSAVPITGEGMLAMTASGKPEPYETPRALETLEITEVIEAFRQGARNALAAGFDGVEIHGANGYLLEQFLQSHTNLRTDRYGGSIANRARLLLEIVNAAIAIWGADRVAVRLSPHGVANGSGEPDPMPLYSHVISALDALGLAYLHFNEPRSSGAGRAEVNHQNVPSAMKLFRPLWRGVLISAGGFDGPSAQAAVAAGHADAIAFGRHFISNPDLPARIRHGVPLHPITARPSMAARRPAIPIIRFTTSCSGRSPYPGRGAAPYERRRPSNPEAQAASSASNAAGAKTLPSSVVMVTCHPSLAKTLAFATAMIKLVLSLFTVSMSRSAVIL
jgi:N-ethylmaleimide reductase